MSTELKCQQKCSHTWKTFNAFWTLGFFSPSLVSQIHLIRQMREVCRRLRNGTILSSRQLKFVGSDKDASLSSASWSSFLFPLCLCVSILLILPHSFFFCLYGFSSATLFLSSCCCSNLQKTISPFFSLSPVASCFLPLSCLLKFIARVKNSNKTTELSGWDKKKVCCDRHVTTQVVPGICSSIHQRWTGKVVIKWMDESQMKTGLTIIVVSCFLWKIRS